MSAPAGQIFTLDPELRFEADRIADFHALWQRKCAGREMPSRRDFDVLDFRPFLGFVSLTDVSGEAEPRFRYRLIGSNITARVGRDVTGRWMHEIYRPEMLEGIVVGFRWILRHRRPIRAVGTLQHADRQFLRIEVVDAPLSSDGSRIDMFASCLHFDEQDMPP